MADQKQQLVTRTQLAELAGVTPAAVSKSTKSGALAPAVVGKRVDASHPAALEYVRKHGGESAVRTLQKKPHVRGPAAAKQKRKAAATPGSGPAGGGEVPENIEAFAEWTIRDVVARFGTDQAFVDYLKAVKEIESIAEKRIKNARERGDLIPREFVRTHLFGALDGFNVRLLNDAPKSLARKLYAAAKAGKPIEDGEEIVRKEIGGQLKAVKAKTAKAIKNA